MLLVITYDFVVNDIPARDNLALRRYGATYAAYMKRSWTLVPLVY